MTRVNTETADTDHVTSVTVGRVMGVGTRGLMWVDRPT